MNYVRTNQPDWNRKSLLANIALHGMENALNEWAQQQAAEKLELFGLQKVSAEFQASAGTSRNPVVERPHPLPSIREFFMFLPFVIGVVWMGVYPEVFRRRRPYLLTELTPIDHHL